MSFFRDFDFTRDGDILSFRNTVGQRTLLLPGKSVEVEFRAVEGPIDIHIMGLEWGNEADIDVVGPQADPRNETGEGRGSVNISVNHVELQVELRGPGNQLVQTWTTEQDPSSFIGNFEHVVGTGEFGIWKCRVVNSTVLSANFNVSVDFVYAHVEAKATDIPVRLLNHVFSIVLEAVAPRVRIDRNKVRVSFGEELLEFFGEEAEGLGLGERVITIPYDIEGSGKLLNVVFEVGSGYDLLAFMNEVWMEKKEKLEDLINTYPNSFAPQKQLTELNEWKSGWDSKVKEDYPTIHFSVVISDIEIEKEFLVFEIDLAEIEEFIVEVFVAFDYDLGRCHALVHSAAEFSGGMADVAEDLGIIAEPGKYISDYLAEPIMEACPGLSRYLGEVLVQLVERSHVFLKVTAEKSAWRVEHCTVPWYMLLDFGHGQVVDEVTTLDVSVDGDHSDITEAPVGLDEFIIQGDAENLRRLDEIETIIVLMMENRSFDHLLGYLRVGHSEKYEGLRLHSIETNPPFGPFLNRFEMVHASEVVRSPITKILLSPHHINEHVLDQIADGAMSGFVKDFFSKTDNPQLAMTYYTERELPTYYQLAYTFLICDHWFSAHPGPTWPNRWCTLTGTSLELDNIDISDPRLGYLKQFTIFDLLDMYGISWRYFESDIATLRMFDRYRLNSTNVVPFYHPTDGYEALAEAGNLPNVVFIDPNFIDIPPRSTANDDLAPADLARGQDFVAHIYNILISSKQWNKAMFIITYDEHGGFYDHLPPPGTALGPKEWYDETIKTGKVPLIHPDGSAHYGVRVPGIVVSPWVGSGSVSHEIFDHTSIIKTILVRHRDKFSDPNDLLRFGSRVNQAAHLGLVLDRETARTTSPSLMTLSKPLPRPRPEKRERLKKGTAASVAKVPAATTTKWSGHAKVDRKIMELTNNMTTQARHIKNIERSRTRLKAELTSSTATAVEPHTEESARISEGISEFHLSLKNAFFPRKP